MSEDQWLSWWKGLPNNKKFANEIANLVSVRKLRLFACACCRRLWDNFTSETRELLLLAERHADKTANTKTLPRSLNQVRFSGEYSAPVRLAAYRHDNREVLLDAVREARHAAATRYWESRYDEAIVEEAVAQMPLLRDIFGNLFRPVAFDPTWQTSAATALASQMYDSRDFSAMPVLADALEEAGCENADVLDHCRNPEGVHVRGCWVVDLVLGKA